MWVDKNIPRWFGNDVYEGCCRCSGGLRNHGIPESMTRWLYSADRESLYTGDPIEISGPPSGIDSSLGTYHPGPNDEAQGEWESTFFVAPYNVPAEFKLSGTQGACFTPRTRTGELPQHWIQMWLGHARETVTSITTKGSPNGRITKYTVGVSVDTEVWFPLECVVQDENGWCVGNTDIDTPVTNEFSSPGRGKYVRLYVKEYESMACVRMGVNVEAPKCRNTFSINSDADNILGSANSPSIVGKDIAVNNICEAACRNGYPNIPDIGKIIYDLRIPSSQQTITDLLTRLYNGCCECMAEAQSRPTDGSFWHIRMSSEKVSTQVTAVSYTHLTLPTKA